MSTPERVPCPRNECQRQSFWPDHDKNKTVGLILSFLGLFCASSVYSFPTFTSELLNQGINPFSVVAMGALSQAALLFGNLVGAMITSVRPSGWAGRWTDASLLTLPTLLQSFSCLAVAVTGNSPGLGLDARAAIYYICWFLIGTGLGAQFNTSINIQKANFLSFRQRQLAVTMQTLAIGAGAL